MPDQPDHNQIMECLRRQGDKLQSQELAVARLEERQSGITAIVEGLHAQLDRLTTRLDALSVLVESMNARQKSMFFMSVTGIPLLLALGIYGELFR